MNVVIPPSYFAPFPRGFFLAPQVTMKQGLRLLNRVEADNIQEQLIQVLISMVEPEFTFFEMQVEYGELVSRSFAGKDYSFG
jgi:hypothetical protein